MSRVGADVSVRASSWSHARTGRFARTTCRRGAFGQSSTGVGHGLLDLFGWLYRDFKLSFLSHFFHSQPIDVDRVEQVDHSGDFDIQVPGIAGRGAHAHHAATHHAATHHAAAHHAAGATHHVFAPVAGFAITTAGAAIAAFAITTAGHATHHAAAHHAAWAPHHAATHHAAAHTADGSRRGIADAHLAYFEHQIGVATVSEELLYLALIDFKSHAHRHSLGHCKVGVTGVGALHFSTQVFAGDRFEFRVNVAAIRGIDHRWCATFAHHATHFAAAVAATHFATAVAAAGHHIAHLAATVTAARFAAPITAGIASTVARFASHATFHSAHHAAAHHAAHASHHAAHASSRHIDSAGFAHGSFTDPQELDLFDGALEVGNRVAVGLTDDVQQTLEDPHVFLSVVDFIDGGGIAAPHANIGNQFILAGLAPSHQVGWFIGKTGHTHHGCPTGTAHHPTHASHSAHTGAAHTGSAHCASFSPIASFAIIGAAHHAARTAHHAARPAHHAACG